MSNSKATINIIAAACENMGIGIKGQLPWRLKKEMNFFKEKTSTTNTAGKQNAVIMGRKTWFSIPEKFRPMPKRFNIVLTSTQSNLAGPDYVANSFDKAMEWLQSPEIKDKVDKIFVIGGAAVYKIAMDSNYNQRIYLTRIQTHFDCDTFFPEIDEAKYKLAEDQDVPDGIQEENGITYKHFQHLKIEHQNVKLCTNNIVLSILYSYLSVQLKFLNYIYDVESFVFILSHSKSN